MMYAVACCPAGVCDQQGWRAGANVHHTQVGCPASALVAAVAMVAQPMYA